MDLEKQIFSDMFNFIKENYKVSSDPEYWSEIVRQQTELEQKYKGSQFAKDMLYACTKRLCELCDKEAS